MLQCMAVWIIVTVSAVFVARCLLKGIKVSDCDCFYCSGSSCTRRVLVGSREVRSGGSIKLAGGESLSEDKG